MRVFFFFLALFAFKEGRGPSLALRFRKSHWDCVFTTSLVERLVLEAWFFCTVLRCNLGVNKCRGVVIFLMEASTD